MRKLRKCKCLHCKQQFQPDPRNASRQKYCSLPACRKASKAASQKKWLAQPGNQDYFRGPENTSRVQQWRWAHPGYWRKSRDKEEPLQDSLSGKTVKHQEVIKQLPSTALQDLLSVQPVVFLGLLAHLSGSPLQDDIVTIGRRLQQLGQDILTESFCPKGGCHDNQQDSYLSTHDPPGA